MHFQGTLQLPTDLKTTQSLLKQDQTDKVNNTVNNKKEFLCEKCNKNFSCKQNYEVHLKAVHEGERPFACERCNKRFSYANSLKVHLLQHFPKSGADDETNAQYKCPSCPKSFRHPSSLQYHRDSEHTNGRRSLLLTQFIYIFLIRFFFDFWINFTRDQKAWLQMQTSLLMTHYRKMSQTCFF